MAKQVEKCGKVALPYYIRGTHPKWLIDSVTHGNEAGVKKSVGCFIADNEERMPDFLWVPEVSPSAARLGTRRNARGVDVNRVFGDDTEEVEAQANISVWQRHRFTLHLSFHEDTDRTNEFYVYDTADAAESVEAQGLLAAAERFGFTRYTGTDNWRSKLSVNIVNGYFSERWKGGGFRTPALSGQATIYTVTKGIAERAFTIEIPGKAPQERKNILVAAILNHFIAIHEKNANRDDKQS